MNGLKALRTICLSLLAGVALAALACLLPDDPYQRWQLTDNTIFDQLRRTYERIHYDDRPIDVAIVGPSRTLLGLSAQRIGQQLSAQGERANVENFSVVAAGRNVQWAIIDELFKTKSPKVLVLGVDGVPASYGHPAFKYVAPAGAVAFPPAPLLHNYFFDVSYLPSRELKLIAARLFPSLFGLRKDFNPAVYAATRSEFTSGILHLDNKTFDMDQDVSAETLRKQVRPFAPPTFADRLVLWCCNDGDDHVYIRAISELADAHGTRLVFAFFPTFGGTTTIYDRDFLSQRGLLVDNGDMARNASFFENWSHFNHAGAMMASERVASAIAAMKISKLDQSKAQ
jgi:hypothetical protein